jgi:integrase/recombinase XerD
MGYLMSHRHAILMDEFLSSEKPKVSKQGYRSLEGLTRRVLRWFDGEELDILSVNITDALHFAAWIASYRDDAGHEYATGTVHNYIKVARRFFEYLVQTERIKTNPFKELRYPRLPEHLSRNVLSEAQMGRLLRELARFDQAGSWDEQIRCYRVHVIAEFLYASGLRIAEASSLVVSNLDLPHRLVYVPSGKGGKPRTAFLTGYACDVMGRYLSGGRQKIMAGYVRQHEHTLFGADKSQVARVVNDELARVCARLELPIITTHGFRHSLGTHLLRSGCDMRHIQVILGHDALGTTQIYTRVDKEDLRRSLDEFHPRRFHAEPQGWQSFGTNHWPTAVSAETAKGDENPRWFGGHGEGMGGQP